MTGFGMKKLYVILFLVLTVALAKEASATSVLVNNGWDVSAQNDGICTLREAVDTTNAGANLDNGCALAADGNAETTIEFSVSNIVLTQGVIELEESVVINRADATNRVVIEAPAGSGVFFFNRMFPDPSPDRSFTFNHLEISSSDLTVDGAADRSQISINFGSYEGVYSAVFNGCYFKNNKTKNNGVISVFTPAAGNNVETDVLDSTFIGNEGGVLSVNLVDLDIERSTFNNNSGAISGIGGGALFAFRSTVTVRDSEFDGNTSTTGGALYVREPNDPTDVPTGLEVYDSVFTNNEATSLLGGGFGSGGAIAALNLDSLSVDGATISNNTAFTAGGGIESDGHVPLIITNSILQNNHADTDGGAIRGGVVYAEGVRFIDNSADGKGGGVYSQAGFEIETTEIKQSSFIGNQAVDDGGGLWMDGLGNTILESTFSGNKGAFGGGVFLNTTSNENRVVNSTFSGNHATESGGGIALFSADSSEINNVTFTKNSARSEAGGVYLYLNLPGIKITNTIIANSTAEVFPDARDCSHVGGLPTTMANSLVQDGGCNVVNLGGIQADPELSDFLNDNGGPTATHMLLNESLAKDAGDNASCEATDQRGQPRPDAISGLCDMGAFEIQLGEGVEETEGSFYVIPTKNGNVAIYL